MFLFFYLDPVVDEDPELADHEFIGPQGDIEAELMQRMHARNFALREVDDVPRQARLAPAHLAPAPLAPARAAPAPVPAAPIAAVPNVPAVLPVAEWMQRIHARNLALREVRDAPLRNAPVPAAAAHLGQARLAPAHLAPAPIAPAPLAPAPIVPAPVAEAVARGQRRRTRRRNRPRRPRQRHDGNNTFILLSAFILCNLLFEFSLYAHLKPKNLSSYFFILQSIILLSM